MGSKPSSNVTQTNKVELGPEQKKVFGMAMPSIEAYSQSQPQIFGGSGVADFNPLETQAQSMYTNLVAPAAGQMAGTAAQTNTQMMDPDFMLNPNQYVHAAADATVGKVTRNLQDTVLPGIRSGAEASGGGYSGGSTREGVATGLAIDRTNQGLSDSLADMYLKNYQSGMTNMAGAVGRNTQAMKDLTFAPDVLGAVGGQQRLLEQARLDEEIAKFYSEQDLDLSKAQNLMALIGQMPGGVGTSTVSGAQPGQNPLMMGLGLMSSLGGMFGGGGAGGLAALGPGLAMK